MAIDASWLCCPVCRSALTLQEDSLACSACGAEFPVLDDIPHLLLNDSPATQLSHDDYDEHHAITDNSQHVMQQMWHTVLAEHGLSPGHVLEIGCGTGQLTAALASMPGLESLHTTDLSPTFLAMARQQWPQQQPIHYYACDAHHLPFAPNRFDLIVGNSVLHHLLDYPQVLQQCHALLKPGGAAVFFEPVLQGKVMVAFLASLLLRIARKTGYGALTPEDEKNIARLVRHITKAREFADDPSQLARMEDKFVFDLHALRETGLAAGFSQVHHRNNPAQDGQFRFNLHQHLRMAGLAEHKIADFRFLMNTAHDMLIGMIPRDLFTPMGFFVFRKAG